MLEIVYEVLVFKTTIATKVDHELVAKMLNADPRIKKWNVDQFDVDCVLRVEGDKISAAEIKQIVSEGGYLCEELPD